MNRKGVHLLGSVGSLFLMSPSLSHLSLSLSCVCPSLLYVSSFYSIISINVMKYNVIVQVSIPYWAHAVMAAIALRSLSVFKASLSRVPVLKVTL